MRTVPSRKPETLPPSAASRFSRRELLRGAAATTAASAIVGPFFPGRVLGANDRINLAVVGIRGQGTAHINGFPGLPGVNLKTLCDIDENLYAGKLKSVQDKRGYTPGTEWEMRRVFDDKDIHAVSFALPNHWHVLASIWACQAGKHVYVEKPACHTIWEGRQLVHAARKYNVAVQVGFQNRSRVTTKAAIDFLRSGKLGKVFMAKGLCYKPRGDIGRWPDGPMSQCREYSFAKGGGVMPPYTESYLAKVHYDNWIGPAPGKPFNPNRFHYNWHWQWDYGNGDTGNQGPHQFDVGRWGLGREDYPVKIRSSGGMYLYDSQQETPNVHLSTLEYADGTLFQFETRGTFTNPDGKITIGNIFYGSEGRLEIDADGHWKTYFGPKDEPGPNSEPISARLAAAKVGGKAEKVDARLHVGTGIDDHLANFIDAVRSGRPSDLNCEAEIGFRSSVLPHLANIAYRVGAEVKFDGKAERFIGNDKANGLLHRKDRKGYAIPNLGKTGLVATLAAPATRG